MRKSDYNKKWKKIHSVSCYRKVRYGTREQAVQGAIEYRKKYGSYMTVYQCKACGLYHIGH